MNFLFNADAYFRCDEHFGKSVIEAISASGTAGFDATCYVASVMTEECAAWHKYMGLEPVKVYTVDEIKSVIKVSMLIPFRTKVLEAIAKGMTSGDDEDIEVDLVLEEINKKKEKIAQ